MEYVWVGLGGAVGANARFVVGRAVGERTGDGFPWGTLLVNLTGSLLIGILLTLLGERRADPAWRLLLVVGVLGGYTTFSAFSWEAVALLRDGQAGRAIVYVVGSATLGPAACAVGIGLARAMVR